MYKARRGIYAAAISPVTPQGELDLARLTAYCRHLLQDGGLDGVAPMGTTGEGTSFALADRLALPAALAGAGIATDRVILGIGAAATADSVALARAALDAGYCNLLALPPFYYKHVGDDGLYAHYARLIDATGDDRLRLYLYHFPQISAVPLSPALVARLRQTFGPLIAGLKDSSGDFAQTRAFVDATGGIDDGFDIYPSSESLLFRGRAAGCAGVISGSTNAFGRLVQAALAAGPDSPQFERVAAARDFAAGFNLIAAMKQAEYLRSGDDAWLRLQPPLVPLADSQAALFRDGLAAFRDS